MVELVREQCEIKVPVLTIAYPRSPRRRDQTMRAGVGEVLTTTPPSEEIVVAAKRLIGASRRFRLFAPGYVRAQTCAKYVPGDR